MTIARLFPDTPLKQVIAGTLLLAASYVAAGLANASPVVQPRLSTRSRGAVILVVPPPAEPEAGGVPAERPLNPQHRAL